MTALPEKIVTPAPPVRRAKVRRKSVPLSVVTRPLFRSLMFATLAGLLGASGAALMVYAAPGVTARLAGTLYCPDQSAAISTVRGPKLSELHPKAPPIQLEAQTMRCTAAEVEAAPLRADLAWYGTWAAGAAGMTGLVYWMWVITSTLAFQPDPEAAARKGEPREDLPARFLEECCDVAPKQRAPAAQLYAAYAAWCRALGHYPPAAKDVHREWKRLGLKRRGLLRPNAWRGVKLKEQF